MTAPSTLEQATPICPSCENGRRIPNALRRDGTGEKGEPLYVCDMCGEGPSDDWLALVPQYFDCPKCKRRKHDGDCAEDDCPMAVAKQGLPAIMTTLECAESPALDRVLTIRTERGDEFVINADAAAKALADLFSDIDNEHRFGWHLERAWYEDELRKLRDASLVPHK